MIASKDLFFKQVNPFIAKSITLELQIDGRDNDFNINERYHKDQISDTSPNPASNSHSQNASKPPGAIIRIGSIVIDEDSVIAAIPKDSTTKFSNFNRCF